MSKTASISDYYAETERIKPLLSIFFHAPTIVTLCSIFCVPVKPSPATLAEARIAWGDPAVMYLHAEDDEAILEKLTPVRRCFYDKANGYYFICMDKKQYYAFYQSLLESSPIQKRLRAIALRNLELKL